MFDMDDKFGQITESEHKDWQAEHGLEADSIAG
jgi:hypothetical protein